MPAGVVGKRGRKPHGVEGLFDTAGAERLPRDNFARLKLGLKNLTEPAVLDGTGADRLALIVERCKARFLGFGKMAERMFMVDPQMLVPAKAAIALCQR